MKESVTLKLYSIIVHIKIAQYAGTDIFLLYIFNYLHLKCNNCLVFFGNFKELKIKDYYC